MLTGLFPYLYVRGRKLKEMTTREVADYLKVHPKTLAIWRHRDQGPRYYRVGVRDIRYSQEDVEAWLAENRQTPQNNGK